MPAISTPAVNAVTRSTDGPSGPSFHGAGPSQLGSAASQARTQAGAPLSTPQDAARAPTVPGFQDGGAQHVQAASAMPRKRPAESQPAGPSTTKQRARDRSSSAPDVVMASPYVGHEAAERAGHLKQMRLENFMCHTCLEIEFGPHATIVSGTNGSGKSAVVQALQACLGASAKETGRGSKMVNLIQTGKHEARLQVTLWNTGAEAYEPEKFGDTITIERRLTQTTNAYKMLNHHGKVVETSRAAINRYMEQKSLDATNPLVIITQEAAKTFARGNASDRQRKYEIFEEGTLLKSISVKLAAAQAELHEMREIAREIKEQNANADAELKPLRDKLQQLKLNEERTRLLHDIDNVLAWANARTYQALLDRADAQHAAHPAKVDQIRRQIVEKQAALEQAKAAVQAQHERMARVRDAVTHMREEVHQLKKAYAIATKQRAAAQERLKEELAVLQDTQSEAQGLEERLKQDAAAPAGRKAQEAQARLAEFQEQLKGKTDLVAQLGMQFKAKREAHTALVAQVQAARQQESAAAQALQQSSRMVQEMMQQLDALQAAAVDRVMTFGGAQAKRLVDEVQRHASSFTRMPIGPIGMSLSLADNKWAAAVEVAIGGQLNQFLCHNKEDTALLRSLAAQVGYRQITAVTTNLDTPAHVLPARDFQGVPRVMDVVHPVSTCTPAEAAVILNYLIDKAQVDVTMLVDSAQQGRQVAHQGLLGPGLSAIDVDGTAFRKSGSTFTTTASSRRDAPRLGRDSQAAMQQARAYLEAEHDRARELRQQRDAASGALKDAEAAERAAQHESAQVMQQLNAAKKAISELQQRQQQQLASGDDGGEEAVIAATTQRLLDVQVEKAQAQGAVEQAEQALAAAVERERLAREAWEARNRGSETDVADGARIAADIERLSQEEGHAAAAVKQAEAQLQEEEATDQALQQDIVVLSEQVAEVVDLARGMCPEDALPASQARVQQHCRNRLKQLSNRDKFSAEQWEELVSRALQQALQPDKLEAERARLKKHVDTVQREAKVDVYQLETEIEQLEKKTVHGKAALERIRQQLSKLVESCQSRWSKLLSLTNHTQTLVQSKFDEYMRRRSHRGRLDFRDSPADGTAGELCISVQIRGLTEPANKWVDDLKSLSGGERSFTTLCFLMAVGEVTHSPFRVLDEFDVYMDPRTRHLAVKSLLEFVRMQHDNQYILLTPQELSAFRAVHKEMEDKYQAQLAKGVEEHEAGRLPDNFIVYQHIQPARANATQVPQ